MSHERLKSMKETLMCAVEGQLCNIHEADTKELGEAIDMIKDLEEAMYYCTVVEAMEQKEEEPHYMMRYYPMKEWEEPNYRDMDRWDSGRMYYSDWDKGGAAHATHGTSSTSTSGHGTSYFGGNEYSEKEYPFELRDYREGRSPKSRKMYMESKEMNKDKASHLRELEKYMQELTADIVEMIEDASAEEKQYLEKKISSLAQKISQLNG